MQGDIGLFFLLGFLFLFLFLAMNKPKKKQILSEPDITPPKKAIRQSTLSINAVEKELLHPVEEKKRKKVFRKSLLGKGSIRQAFILSEIFRKVDL